MNKFLSIFEDGSLHTWDHIPPEIAQAAQDGLYTIVDMSTGKVSYDGETWEDIEKGKWNPDGF